MDDDLLPPRRPRTGARPRTRPFARATGDGAGSSMISPTGPFIGAHAIVVGGSVAGIMAARVLSDYFERVSVIERDYLNARPIGRKGTPQARHIHILLAAGAAVLAELFPDVAADMPSAGSIPVDAARDLRWFHFGVWKARVDSGIILYLCNRMVLETALRAELRRRANVTIIDDCDVLGLLVSEGRPRRVTGVRYLGKGESEPRTLEADVVVDSSGRGSRSPRWLADAGFARVAESEVRVNVGYASRVYRMPRTFPSERLPLAVFPKPPDKRLGVMFSIDGGVLMVTLSGIARDHPPTTNDGFAEFARSLPVAEFHELLGEARPAPAIHGYQVPSDLRRHYERMAGFPDGYLVVGDALCSFNPIYGQGMSAAALQIRELGVVLGEIRARGGSITARGTGRRIQRRASRMLNLPWLLATCEDFRFRGVTGPRPLILPILQWYVAHVLELSSTHADIARRFALVMNLVAGPAALLTPSVVLAVLWHSLRGRPSGARASLRPSADAGRDATEPCLDGDTQADVAQADISGLGDDRPAV